MAPGWGTLPLRRSPLSREAAGGAQPCALCSQGQDVGGRPAPMRPSAGGARALLVFRGPGGPPDGAPWDGSPLPVGQRLASLPSAARRPARAQPVAQPLLPSLRRETRDPASSPLCSCHLHPPVGCPFPWRPGCRGGHSPPAPPFLGLGCPARRASCFKGCPPDQAGRRSGHTQQGYQHY